MSISYSLLRKLLMRHIIFIFQLLLSISLVYSCSKKNEEDTLPKSENERSFHMGFTAFPYDLSLEALGISFKDVNEKGDIFLAHFDNGVPWKEALNDLPFPTEIKNSINSTKLELAPENKLILTATATSTERNKLAGYWNDSGSYEPLEFPWSLYSFKEPQVITAYLKYCKRLINELNPDYFGYGIEINATFQKGTKAYEDYLEFADTVYYELKATYPSLPVFLSFQDVSFNKTKKELLEVTKAFLPFTDIIAISTYPYWDYNQPKRDANPDLIDDNWLSELRNLDPNKPFAVSETGFCAENLVLDEVGVNIKAKEEWQDAYAEKLFIKANDLEAEFIIWFVYRDYDLLYNKTNNPHFVLKVWKDIGLKDGEGNKRAIHNTWDKWLGLPLK